MQIQRNGRMRTFWTYGTHMSMTRRYRGVLVVCRNYRSVASSQRAREVAISQSGAQRLLSFFSQAPAGISCCRPSFTFDSQEHLQVGRSSDLVGKPCGGSDERRAAFDSSAAVFTENEFHRTRIIVKICENKRR